MLSRHALRESLLGFNVWAVEPGPIVLHVRDHYPVQNPTRKVGVRGVGPPTHHDDRGTTQYIWLLEAVHYNRLDRDTNALARCFPFVEPSRSSREVAKRREEGIETRTGRWV